MISWKYLDLLSTNMAAGVENSTQSARYFHQLYNKDIDKTDVINVI